MATIEIVLPKLHPAQAQVRREFAAARFGVLACGRRWGKTRLGAALCVATAVQGGRAWWVAPSYRMALVGWRLIHALAAAVPLAEIRRGDMAVLFPGGGEVRVRSADNPDSLRGEGLDFAILDECAFMHEDAWRQAIRPALSDRQGRALFISTPKGRNWFWRLFARAQAGEDGWRAWRFPTSANPYIRPAEIEAARRDLPERIFRQEYLAEFIDDAGGVFRRVIEAATAEARDHAEDGHEYVFGVDWARENDFTAFAVVDVTTRALVHLERMNQVEYTHQTMRLKALAERFSPRVIVAEANAMGAPLIEALQRDGLPVQPFTTTAATKQRAIDALALAFERGDIRILRDEVLIAELQAFEMKRLPSGHIRYAAPEGMHDDTVMALALAWWAVAETKPILFMEA